MKYALVMGASGDIGQACVEQLAAKGWSVYCHYYHGVERVSSLIKKLQAQYPQQDFFSISLNMACENEIPAFLKKLFQVDAVIFASGQTIYKLLTDTTSDDMDYLWQVFIKTPVLLCQQLQKKLAHAYDGRIVFIGSVYGLVGSSMEVFYSTVKGAQQAFAKAYAQEVATLGITVNVVAPGAVNTKMNESWTLEEQQDLLEEIPIHRMAEPIEIAAIVTFLLEKNAKYITGTTIPVTGGWKM